jgi:hypothetical protein
MADTTQVHTLSKELSIWIGEGGGSIMLKTYEPHGDPVELSHGEVIELIQILQTLAAQID